MLLLGLWLVAQATCDLLRSTRDHVEARRASWIGLFGVLLFAFLVVAAGADSAWVLCVAVVTGLGLFVFVVASARALNLQGGPAATRSRQVALAAMGVSLALLLVTAGRTSLPGGLLLRGYDGLAIDSLGPLPFGDLFLVLGLFLFQLASANIVVRIILDGVGVPPEASELQIKGGRLLGPLERLFILGLGLAGQVTAASIVIAAKGILRYPELAASTGDLQAARRHAEYILVGSFLSWLIAMAGLPLL